MKEYQEILQLIKISQFSEIDSIIQKDFDWNFIYNEALSQSVMGIVASVVPKDVVDSESGWQKAFFNQKASYIRYCHAEDELKKILDEAEIPFVILKGNAAAIYYKQPELRQMGDIDFLVSPEDYERAKDILLRAGFSTYENAEDCRNIGLKKNGIKYELHHRFSANDLFIEDVVSNGFRNRTVERIGVHEFYMLPKEANGLVLLEHMRMHLKSGIGLRQIIDWMMFVDKEMSDYDWGSGFGKIVREKKLETLAITITKMCQIYLGLPSRITWCKDADVELCSRIMNNVMNSGNFGRKHESGSTIERVSTSFRRNGFFRTLQKSGEKNWKLYKKHHWLKPFAWIYQGFRYIRLGFRTGRNRKQISGDVQRSKERVKLLKDLGL